MRRVPLIVTLEFQTKLVVVNSQVAVTSARYRLWRYLRNLLGNDPNIGCVAAVIAEAVETKPVVEITDQNHVVLKSDVRTASSSATAGATATTATAAAAPHSATAAAARAHATAATATTSGDVLPASATMGRSRACRAIRSPRLCALP